MATVEILYEGYVKEGDNADIVRNTVCIVKDKGLIIVVDPGLVDPPEVLTASLAEHGLRPEDVTHIYVTHSHMDHIRNVGLFPTSTIVDYMYTYEGERWGEHSGDGHHITEDVWIMHTPGHTKDDSALLIKTKDGVVAISHVWWFADKTPNEDPMAEDQESLEESRKKVVATADWIITPHGGIMQAKD